MNPEKYREYAKECERMAQEGPAKNREALLKIAQAWYECAEQAQVKLKNPVPKVSP
jgi:hypothetical protein